MTLEQLKNIWYGIVSDHYDIAGEAWRAVDDVPDTEEEYLSMLIETATGMIEG